MDKISNLVALASDELTGENYEEADRLINEALKEDRTIVGGWIIKAKVAYFLDRGLTASYNYLKNALEVMKSEKDKKDILDAFIFVSYKELNWSLSKTIKYVHDIDDDDRHSPYIDKFEKEGKEFLSLLKDEELAEKTFNAAANKYIDYAIVEIKKKWDEMCNEYYKDAKSDFGAKWAYNNEQTRNNYRPTKYELDRFVDGVFNLSAIATYSGYLSNEDTDLDAVIELLELADKMINCALGAKGFKERSHPYDVNDEYGNFIYTDYRMQWDVDIVVGEKLKAQFIEKQDKIRQSIATLRKNKETYAYNKVRREKNKYWEAHPEEYSELLAQKDAAVEHKNKLQKAYDAKQSEIDAIDSESYEGDEMPQMKEKVEDLEEVKRIRKHMSIFRFGDRKQAKLRIKALKNEINELNFQRHENMEHFRLAQRLRIADKQKELDQISCEIEKCNKLIASIDDKL